MLTQWKLEDENLRHNAARQGTETKLPAREATTWSTSV